MRVLRRLLLVLLLASLAAACATAPCGDASLPRSPLDLFFWTVDDPGGSPRVLAEPELAGEVTLVAALTCDSEAGEEVLPVLARLDASLRPRGVGVIALAFDGSGDHERDTERVAGLARRHGLERPPFLAGPRSHEGALQMLRRDPDEMPPPAILLFDRCGELSAAISWHALARTGDPGELLTAGLEDLLAETQASDTWERLCAGRWTIRPSRAHVHPGRRVTFVEADGRRLARMPGQDDLPVVVRGPWVDAVGTWRLDARAGVLLDPRHFGTRMHPEGGSVTPLLEREGFHGEDGILRALSSTDALVRREALFALGHARKHSGNAPEALSLLDDPELEVRVAAAWALGEAHERGALDALFALAEHPYPPLRCEALSAFAKVSEPEDLERPDVLLFIENAIGSENDPLARWALLREMLG